MKTVIFDFDGTIADSLPLVIDGVTKVLGDLELTDEIIEKYRNMTVLEVVKEIDIPKRKIPKYAVFGRAYMRENVDKLKIFSGMSNVLKQLNRDDIQMIIVSSNNADSISIFLDRYDLKQYFHSIHGGIGVFGKTSVLKKIIKRYKIDKKDAIYVGDEVRDIKSAHKVGLRIVSVTWGFNGKKIINKNSPDAVADSPEQLQKAIKKILG